MWFPAIWYHLQNLKKHGVVLIFKVAGWSLLPYFKNSRKTPPWALSTFFKLRKRQKTAQSVPHYQFGRNEAYITESVGMAREITEMKGQKD